ncbi:hypothetical protein Vafri_9565, partial [Volvox africanus]
TTAPVATTAAAASPVPAATPAAVAAMPGPAASAATAPTDVANEPATAITPVTNLGHVINTTAPANATVPANATSLSIGEGGRLLQTVVPTESNAMGPSSTVLPKHAFPQTDMVMAVLDRTGISKELRMGMAATIFAPEDTAFARLAEEMELAGGTSDLLKSPELYNLTLLHIVPGVALKSSDVPLGEAVTARSWLGDNLVIKKHSTGDIRVCVAADPEANESMAADVVKADVPYPYSNEVVMHIINRIL